MDVVYFVSGSQGKWELSNGQERIGHIEQVGMAFEIRPVAGSILETMKTQSYSSKQEALEAIELHTGKDCKPAVE